MIDKIRIEKGLYWDEAWSLVSGCTPVSEGCANCWSARETHMRAENPNEKVRARNQGLTEAGQFNGRVRLNYEFLEKPLRKKKPTTYAIWNDLFHEDVHPYDIMRIFNVMEKAKQHTFLVLTKRPEKMLEFYKRLRPGNVIPGPYFSITGIGEGWAGSPPRLPDNIWLGITAENQQRADERIPILLQIPAAVRFVSIEPMLGPVDLKRIYLDNDIWINALNGNYTCRTNQSCSIQPNYHPYGGAWTVNSWPKLNWVICGGETGPGARPMHPDWARSLVLQCKNAGVPIFVKQMGSVWAKAHSSDRASNRPEEWPEDLRIRELPPSRNCSLTP